MDEQEKNGNSFSLEDILREFGEALPEPEEDVRIWNGEIPPQSIEPASGDFTDTVRLDDVARVLQAMESPAPDMDATVRFTLESVEEAQPFASEDLESTVRFDLPESQEEVLDDELFIPQVQAETVEPYSDQWEPEYEQPIGEYVPLEPIPFRPRSRFHELKRKLVEGPERRYYELSEQGLGKLQAAIFLNLLVTLLAVGSTAMHAMDMVGPDRLRLLVFFQFFAMLLSALLGSYQLIEGASDLLRRRFSLNTLLLFSFVACCADGILCLQQLDVPCCGAFSLSVTMSLWASYQKRNTEMAQMDTLRKATRLDSIVTKEDVFEGNPGFLQSEGQVEDFMDTYRQPSAPEKVLSVYALTALFVSLAAGITAGLLHSLHMGVQVFCASLLVAMPTTAHITLSRPQALLQRRLHKHGTVICGWQGVAGLSRSAVYPLADEDVFPIGSAKLNGLKFYGSRQSDDVVAYSAALICAGGGGLAPLFNQLLESRNGYRYEVTGLRGYPGGGIGGEINGEAVLAGTLAFMQAMGVEMPQGTRVSPAVYVSIDGTLCGVYAITYNKLKSAAMGLTTLCAYRGLVPVMTGGDFMLTPGFLRSKFGVNVRRIQFPERNVRQALREIQPEEGAPALALTVREGLAGRAYAVTGARALRIASVLGVGIHLLGGISGLVMMAALAIVGAEYLLTPANVLLYQLIWTVPGLLITEWTRTV